MKSFFVFELAGGVVTFVHSCFNEIDQEETFKDCVTSLGVDPYDEIIEAGVFKGEDITVQSYTLESDD